MVAPISIGVELEFLLAHLYEGKEAPATESRQLTFSLPDAGLPARQKCVQLAIAKLLHNHGFKINQTDPSAKTMERWQVDFDSSLEDPEPEHPDYNPDYNWAPMEVISPAMALEKKSFDQITQVCDLLQTSYVTCTNDSTGLHVHTGRFAAPVPFSLIYLKKLITFLYVFEPQISSLHTLPRVDSAINGTYTANIRDRCGATISFQRENGYRPLPALIVPMLLEAKTLDELLALGTSDTKWFDYNFVGLQKAQERHVKNQLSINGEGNTIEFRQHAGTLDGEAICMWIRVLGGILNFIEDVSAESFVELIGKLTAAETWEKEHDGKDDEREKKHGPVPADGPFTVIDLLRHLDLNEEAEYYKTRWVIHTRTKPRPIEAKRFKDVRWDFENDKKEVEVEETEEYLANAKLKTLWENIRVLEKMQGTLNWDPDASHWPKHEVVSVSKNKDKEELGF